MQSDSSRCVLNQDSGARQVLDLMTDKWAVLIVYALETGTKRFSDLNREVEGVSQKMLIQTLRKLERHGLVKRTVYPVVPPMVEYELTGLGRSLRTLTQGLCDWAEQYLDDVVAARAHYDAQAV